MDDARAQFSARPRKRPNVVEEGVGEGSGFHPRADMHHHARGFIDNHQVAVFVDDIQRQVFGRGSELVARGTDGDACPRRDFRSGLVNGLGPNRHPPGTDLPLHLAAAPIGHAPRQENVQAHSGVFGRDFEFPGFRHSGFSIGH